MYNVEIGDGLVQASAQRRGPEKPSQRGDTEVVDRDTVQVDGPVQWDIEIAIAVNARRVHVDFMPALRERRGQAMHRANGAAIAHRRVVSGHDVKDPQPRRSVPQSSRS